MKKIVQTAGLVALLGAVLAPLPAAAQVAFNVGAVTDYRYRGISQTRLQPAVQGGVDYTAGAFYVGAWASTIKWIKDAGGDASVEIDLYGGYKGEITKELTYDVGFLTYQYPSNKLSPTANTYELYGAATFGPATLKYSHSVSDLFGFANSKNSGYLDLTATFDLGDGLSVAPHLGYQKVAHNKAASYTDYSVLLAKDFSGLVVSGGVYGTDNDTYVAPNGKNLGRAGLVAGIKYNF